MGAEDVRRTLALPDGSILMWLLEGADRLSNGESVERYGLARFDPVSWSIHRLPEAAFSGAAVTLVQSGHVALAGGYQPGVGAASDSVYLLDPCSGDLIAADTLATTRVGGTATDLGDGHLLLVGGDLGQNRDISEPAAPEVVSLSTLPPVSCDEGLRGRDG